MALKRLVIEHGVPKGEANAGAPTKGYLKELAIKHGCTGLRFADS